MASDLIFHLKLDSDCPSKVISVNEINNCDSTFIINSVLNHNIKNKTAVIIISTHNSLMHYQQVGLKMNYNLQKHVDSGLIKFYNLGESVVRDLIINHQDSLQQQLPKIKEVVDQMLQTHKIIHFIMDGVSHMFDLGFDIKQVNSFCSNLIKLSNNINNSYIFFHCNVAIEDDVTSTMASLLSHKAHTIVEVENLQSGLSADVNGHLTIKYPYLKFQSEFMFNLEQKPHKYLFKLFDRGVKLFAPGTV